MSKWYDKHRYNGMDHTLINGKEVPSAQCLCRIGFHGRSYNHAMRRLFAHLALAREGPTFWNRLKGWWYEVDQYS